VALGAADQGRQGVAFITESRGHFIAALPFADSVTFTIGTVGVALEFFLKIAVHCDHCGKALVRRGRATHSPGSARSISSGVCDYSS
jgi:hypothetical protein